MPTKITMLIVPTWTCWYQAGGLRDEWEVQLHAATQKPSCNRLSVEKSIPDRRRNGPAGKVLRETTPVKYIQ